MPQERREDGLTSTPRQRPSWGKRGGWGKVTMISRGVEISIAGGVVAMVRGLSLGRNHVPYICIFLTTLTLVTHHLALHSAYDS